jgi:hypothetical protein
MYTIGFEGASDQIKSAITKYCPIYNNLAKDAANGVGSKLLARWFGSAGTTPKLRFKLVGLDRYLNMRCTRLTFVVKALGAKVDCAEVEAGDYAQVMRNIRDDSGQHFVAGGIRVFVLPAFAGQSSSEQFNTLTHEISHRVLDTTDWPVVNGTRRQTYGRAAALALAATDGQAATTCAENWGYFFMEMFESLKP